MVGGFSCRYRLFVSLVVVALYDDWLDTLYLRRDESYLGKFDVVYIRRSYGVGGEMQELEVSTELLPSAKYDDTDNEASCASIHVLLG